jgi:tetratricopeptide (TPR) repeat protein
MTKSECAPADVLRQLLVESLADRDLGPIRKHLATCPACQSTLDGLSDDAELRLWKAIVPSASAIDLTPLVARLNGNLPEYVGRFALRPEPPAAATSLLSPPAALGDLGTIGPFRVQSELGRGAMGVVYKAHDDALGRVVALKVLASGDGSARRRFVREARAAAAIHSDCVVPIYAVSDPDAAVPFLVMEYIDGPTLRQRVAAEGRLNPREAARLVAQAADGLAAAHALGLVHRDIKPANILHDRALDRARLADFGLARARETASGTTCEGTILGTPEYMSPEQVRAPEQVDARSDVYGLGATLYELLTGEPPFRGTPQMVVQRLLHDDPLPPQRLNEAVPRDVETICLKALAREPARRYPSATALRDDLHRFLAGVPVEARPLGPFGRLVRWARRSPKVAGLSSALLLVGVAGFAAVLWQWRRAEAKSVEALKSAVAAEQQRAQAIANLQTAEENFRQARKAVDTFFTLAAEKNLFDQTGASPLQKKLLEEALNYYRWFVRQRSEDPSVRAELAEAYFRVGVITEFIGDKREALTAFERSAALYQTLAQEHPGDQRFVDPAWNCQFRVGDTLRQLGRHSEALLAFERTQRLLERRVGSAPEDVTLRGNLMATLGNVAIEHDALGHSGEATTLYERMKDFQKQLVKDRPQDPAQKVQLARTYNNLAIRCTDLAESVKYHQQAFALRDELVKTHPKWALYHCELARTCALLGNAAGGQGNETEALRWSQQALTHLGQSIQMEPASTRYQRELAEALNWRGELLRKFSRCSEALAAFEESRRLYTHLQELSPQEGGLVLGLADVDDGLASTCSDLGKDAEALASCRQRLSLLERLVHGFPSGARFQTDLQATRNRIVRLQQKLTGSR